MLALIGGSGLYSLEGLEIEEHLVLDTAFGNPSTAISRGCIRASQFYFSRAMA